jgi:hypothetical protein
MAHRVNRLVSDAGSIGMLGGASLAVYGVPDLFFPIVFRLTGPVSRMYALLLVPPLACIAVGHVALWSATDDRAGRLALLAAVGSLTLSGASVVCYFGLSVTTVAGLVDAPFLGLLLGVCGAVGSDMAFWLSGRVTATERPASGLALAVAPLATLGWLGAVAVTPLRLRFAVVSVPYGLAWLVLGYRLFESYRVRSAAEPNRRVPRGE